jgi:16S rRNA (cytosine967-C5)-methyltransferase
MQIPFRDKHLFSLLELYDQSETRPLDFIVMSYFRQNKQLGSKDRAFISEMAYTLIRWRGLYQRLLGPKATWADCYKYLLEKKPESFLDDESLALFHRVSFPEELFSEIEDSWGRKEAVSICLALNEAAPTSIRVNSLKIDRASLLQQFQEKGLQVAPLESTSGIQFLKKINFFELEEFKKGYFEVQDEASQQVADMVQLLPKQTVLDFCAGSGGKTLAFAPKLAKTGQIYLHDIRQHALYEAKRRLKRAGIQNAQIIHASEEKKLKNLKKRMDVVVVDAPCSGTGTFRRNPDMKWKFSKTMLQRLIQEQREIFSQALEYLKPGGQILYITCSILKKENEDQVAFFLKEHALTEEKRFQSKPMKGKMDGFFASSMKYATL